MNKVNKRQKISFSVVQKDGKKFFAIKVDNLFKEKGYDNTLYFESLRSEVVPINGEVILYRGKEIIDSCKITLKGPGGRDGVGPEFTFTKFKKVSDKLFLNAKNLKVGDRAEIDWDLNDREFKELKFCLENKGFGGSITPESIPILVYDYFVARIGFNKINERIMSPFTAFISELGI